ncbi:UNVERIFIED_CONTAM: hypothetical protein Sradi_0691900 [Sesamum radiatum]|uniref:Uncharacterized protein n=1 Tax=Sesamum radiatum TaxID=300843 RepID=A0AAW2VLI2_SESRA
MCHPSDAEALKYFDQMYPDLEEESCNVRLGFYTDDFAPHDNEFIMRAVLMWTVNDLIAYRMPSGWSTARVMGFPVCMDGTMAFHLQHSYGSDHKWTKKSIFWDLSYWSTLLIRHNLDVMHIEKNVFDNIFNIVMDIKGKTKDNLNARLDLKSICNHPELEFDERRPNVIPKAAYTLTKEQKRRVCEWIKGLKFPNGYASNILRCVDMMELRMDGIKSHNCHVFMQKLILIAILEMLFEHVWSALTELVFYSKAYARPHLMSTSFISWKIVLSSYCATLRRYFLQHSSTQWSTSLFTYCMKIT